MTSIFFPPTGATVTISYSLGQCAGDRTVTFSTTDTWYTLQQDTTNSIVTLTAQAGSNRSGSISVKVGNKPCDPIPVAQGECNCSSFNGSITFDYIIPSGGTSVGTVVGHYTLGGGCPDSSIHFGGDLSLTASNGEIKLNQNIDPNPSTTSTRQFNVSFYYGTDTTPCTSDTLTQEAKEFTCSCDYVLIIVQVQHRYFSNQAAEDYPQASFTPLRDVVIASANTECGVFSATCDNDMLSTQIKGQTVPSKILIEEDNGILQAYVTVLPQSPNADLRTCRINLFFKKKGETQFENCNKIILLTQSRNQYFACNPSAITSLGFLGGSCGSYLVYPMATIAAWNNQQRQRMPHLAAMYDGGYEGSVSRHVHIVPRLAEAGYLKDTMTISGLGGCGFVSMRYDGGELLPDSSVDPYSWASVEVEGQGYVYVKYIANNTDTRRRYVRLDYDVYTEYDYNNPSAGEGLYCTTISGDYAIQMNENCSDCINETVTYYGESWEGWTSTYVDPTSDQPCGGIVIDAGVTDGMGEITNKVYQGEELKEYTLTVYPNNSSSSKDYYTWHVIKFANGEICYKTLTHKSKSPNPCNCSAFKVSHSDSHEEACDYNSGSIYTINTYPATIDVKRSVASYDKDQDECGYKLYIVPTDSSGNEHQLVTQETFNTCNESGTSNATYVLRNFVSGFGYLVKGSWGGGYDTNNSPMLTTNVPLDEEVVDFYYILKLYDADDNYICSKGGPYHYKEGISTYSSSTCTTPSCDNVHYIDRDVSLNSSLETEVIQGDTYIVVHPSGVNNLLLGTLLIEQDYIITGSSGGKEFCEGYKVHFSLQSSNAQKLQVSMASGSQQIYFTVPPYTDVADIPLTIDITPHIFEGDSDYQSCPPLSTVNVMLKFT